MVPSMITYSKSGSPDKRWKIVSNTPLLAHRRNLRKPEFQFPKHSGRSRQGAPTRTIQRTASRKSRVSAAERPGSPAFPGRSGAIRAHCSSRNTLRSKATSRSAALKQIASGLGTPDQSRMSTDPSTTAGVRALARYRRVSSMMSDDAMGWARGLDELGQRLAPCFGRVEPRRRVLAYLKGLLAPIARKNGWQLAEAAGDATPDGVQDFLAGARWEADGVRG